MSKLNIYFNGKDTCIKNDLVMKTGDILMEIGVSFSGLMEFRVLRILLGTK